MPKKQLSFNLNGGTHGGRRSGSGRKRIHSRGVAHRIRERVLARTPLHINFKYKTSIKNKESLKILKKALMNARNKGLRINHYSMQSNHIHLIVEATDNNNLTRGMRSLTVTFAKGLRKGRIQLERYHLHVLRTLREAQHALRYVLMNEQKHENSRKLKVDSYSSLHFLGYEFLKKLVKKEKLGLIWDRNQKGSEDIPRSWILKKAHQQIC